MQSPPGQVGGKRPAVSIWVFARIPALRAEAQGDGRRLLLPRPRCRGRCRVSRQEQSRALSHQARSSEEPMPDTVLVSFCWPSTYWRCSLFPGQGYAVPKPLSPDSEEHVWLLQAAGRKMIQPPSPYFGSKAEQCVVTLTFDDEPVGHVHVWRGCSIEVSSTFPLR